LTLPAPLSSVLARWPISLLVSLRVTDCSLSDERACCQHLASAVSLTSLDDVPMTTAEFARAIGQLPRLTTLRVCGASDEAFREFCIFHSKHRPLLEILHMRQSRFLADVADREFTQLPLVVKITSLRELSLEAPCLCVSRELCELPNLEYLELSVKDARVDIGQCPKLRELRLRSVIACDLGNIAASKSLVFVRDCCGKLDIGQLLTISRIPTLRYVEHPFSTATEMHEVFMVCRRRRIQIVHPECRVDAPL